MQRIKLFVMTSVLVSAALILGACAKNKGAVSSGPAEGTTEPVLKLDILDHQHGQQSAVIVPTLKLVSSSEQFKALGVDAKPAKFKKQDMILVGLGEQPTGGYWVRITNVYQFGSEVVVQATANRPGDDSAVTMALTQPYCLVTVDKLEEGLTLASDFTSVVDQPTGE